MLVAVAGTSESDRADAVVGHVQVFAEHIDDLEADVAVLVEKAEQILAVHLGELQRFQSLGSDFVAAAGKGGAQAHELPGVGYAHGHAAAVFCADGKTHTALAQQENAAGDLAFAKQNGASLAGLDLLDVVEFLESIGLQIAENTICAPPAINTAQGHNLPSSYVDTRKEKAKTVTRITGNGDPWHRRWAG